MKRLIVLALAVLLVLAFVLAQTQNKKSGTPGKAEETESNNPNKAEEKDSRVADSRDAYITAPQAYKLAFENERVRVTRVHYEPREVIESHGHPKIPTVYVYLRDGGQVRFVHTGEEKFTLVRPPVKAGGFRLSRGSEETHRVESLTDQPSDFLRVELKDLKVDRETFRGRFPPEIRQTSKNSEKTVFENEQARIVRLTCAANAACPTVAQTPPYLLIALTPSQLKTTTNNGTVSNLKLELGQTVWVEAGEQLRLENLDKSPARFLRIELKAGNDSNLN